MTRPLRSIHARVWTLLPWVLMAVFIVAVMARRSPTQPNMDLDWSASR
jgi:hypothetical protein